MVDEIALTTAAQRRIGVACADNPISPSTFSGVPLGVAVGLRSLGFDAVPVAATLPPRFERALQGLLARARLRPHDVREFGLHGAIDVQRSRLLASPTLEAAHTMAARIRSRPLTGSGCIQYGTEFSLSPAVPYVTYDDMTVVQARRSYPYDWIRRMSAREQRRLVARQQRIMTRAVACCTTSHWAASSIVEDYGVPPDRVRVVGIGATNTTDPPTDRPWQVPRFLFVGKDWTRKNGDAVLRAFRTVRKHHPDAQLDVVGGHPPLSEPGVTGHGSLPPGDPASRSLIVALQTVATCFVMPSLHEASAIAYVEAARAGVGAIGTTRGGSQTLIGEGGVAVDPEDDDAILDAMLAFADPARARQWGGRAAARSALFSWPAVAARLAAALLGLPDECELDLPSTQPAS